jgi:hypothetical protein
MRINTKKALLKPAKVRKQDTFKNVFTPLV